MTRGTPVCGALNDGLICISVETVGDLDGGLVFDQLFRQDLDRLRNIPQISGEFVAEARRAVEVKFPRASRQGRICSGHLYSTN